MKNPRGKRGAVIAYHSEDEIPSNPFGFHSEALKHINMFICGPRSGIKCCPFGARTVCSDSDVMAGIILAGYLAHGHTLGTCHRRANIIDPGQPEAQNADILSQVLNN